MKCKSNLSIYPSSIHLSIHLSTHPFIFHLSIHPSICPSTHLLIYPSMSIHLSNIYTFFHHPSFNHPYFHPPIYHHSILPSIHLSIHLSNHRYIFPFLPCIHLLIIFFQNKKLNMGNTFWEIFIKSKQSIHPR